MIIELILLTFHVIYDKGLIMIENPVQYFLSPMDYAEISMQTTINQSPLSHAILKDV